MISAVEPFAWRPRIRREPDPRQADLFAAAFAASTYISAISMKRLTFPAGAIPADLPARIPLQVVTSTTEPPDGKGWLHEIKHDGHRLVAIIADGAVKLLSRNARDRTELFAQPFRALATAGLPAMVLDGEIAVPDERGVTHIDALTEALRLRRPEQLAYFAFDLLHLDGHDLRACAIEDRKALLRDIVGASGGPRFITVDHVVGNGAALFEAVSQIGAEGIVSKRAGSPYRGGTGRDWLKTKVSEEGAFVITGYVEPRGDRGRRAARRAGAGRAGKVRSRR